MTLMRWASHVIYSLVGILRWATSWLSVGVLAVFSLLPNFALLNDANADQSYGAAVPERFGEFQWLSPWIETGGTYDEGRDGRFRIFSASFGGRWVGDLSRYRAGEFLEAQVSFGSRSLVASPLRYSRNEETELSPTLIDAFTGVSGNWGRLRFGLLPLLFGLESGLESERVWTRPLIIRRGLIGLRDVGLHYSIASGGFFSDWFVHNGEGGEDLDRELWMTARWEYRLRTSRVQWKWGASGQVGRTAQSATLPAGTTAATGIEMDPSESSRLRFASLFMSSDWVVGLGERGEEADRRFGFELEAFGGEVLQESRTRRIRSLRLDLHWDPTEFWGLFLRGETFDPDSQVTADMLHEASFGLQRYFLKGSMKRSLRGILVATKEILESREQDHHRVEFLLRFSPELFD